LDEQAIRHLRGIDRTLRASALGACLLIAIWVLRDILLLGFAAVLMACVLRGASGFLQSKTGAGSGLSLLAVVVIAALCLGILLWWRGTAIADQATQMVQQLTNQVQRLWEQLGASAWGALLARQLRGAAESLRTGFSGYVPGVASSVLGIGGSIVVVIATALFLAASPQMYVTGGLRLLPRDWRPRGREVAEQIGKTLQLWFLGQLADMIIVATLVGAGLSLLGVPLAVTLALFAGSLNFVPYIGALAGAIPAILVAFSQSPTLALWVTLLFVAVQMLEGNLIAPLIQKRTISLPPALTILSQTILGTLFGAFGLVLATPLVAMLLTAVRMIYVEGVLEGDGDPEARPQSES
jgi:predicted PurR-regulated permease PerM